MNDHTCHIDPMVDSAFQRIFGTAVNKDLLMAFRNEMFRGRKRIVDLVFNKNEHTGETDSEGTAIFDLTCTDEYRTSF